MKNIKGKITVLLIFLIIVFTILIGFTIVRRFFPAGPARPAGPTGPAGSAAPAQPGAPGGGAGQGAAGSGAVPGGASGQREGRSGTDGNAAGSGAGQRGAAPGASGQGGGGQRAGTAVRVTPVVAGTVEHQVILTGDVLSSSQVSIYPTLAGKLTSVRVRAGDRVNRGEVVAVVDPSRPGDTFFPNPVTSTISGVVLSVPVNSGDTVQTNTVICTVGNLADLKVETWVPERHAVTVRRGLPARLRFEALPGETFAAEVDEVSPALDPASRTMRIRLRLVPGEDGRTDPRIMAGMFATVSLVTDSRKGVPVVPRPALIQTYDGWIVFVVSGDSSSAGRRAVTLGLGSETSVEILSGLEPGELVVSEGQNFLTDGDPVRIVE